MKPCLDSASATSLSIAALHLVHFQIRLASDNSSLLKAKKMNPMKTLAAAAMAATMSSELVTAWDGTLTLYEHANFGGSTHTVYFSDATSNDCLNLGCFKDVASSAHWSGIPASNSIGGPIHVQFYADGNCGGTMKRWKSTDTHPSNFQLDGINDQISSFMITEIFPTIDNFITLTCSKSMMEQFGLDASVSNATEAKSQQVNATVPHVVN